MKRYRRFIRFFLLTFGLLVVGALGLMALLSSSVGRAWVTSMVLPQVNSAIAGRVELGALSALSPRTMVLRNLRVRDPNGEEVVWVERVRVRYQLFPLMWGRIQVNELLAYKGRVNAKHVTDARRGLLAALKARDKSGSDNGVGQTEPEDSPPVELNRVRLNGFDVQLPAPAGQAITLKNLSLTGSYRGGKVPRYRLGRLTGQVVKDGTRVGAIGPLQASVTPDGSYALKGMLRAGDTRLPITLHATRSGAESWEQTPFRARLSLEHLSARTLALLGMADFSQELIAPLDMELDIRGTLQRCKARITVGTGGGTVKGEMYARGIQSAGFTLSTASLDLSKLLAGAPQGPVRAALSGSLRRVDEGMSWRVTARQIRVGELMLPDVRASGLLAHGSLKQLHVGARGRGLVADMRGALDSQGGGSFKASVDAPALHDLHALGIGGDLRGGLYADVNARLDTDGSLQAHGRVRVRSLSADAFRAQRLDLTFRASGLRDRPHLVANARGRSVGWRKRVFRTAQATLRGGPRDYRFGLNAVSAAARVSLQGSGRRSQHMTSIAAAGNALLGRKVWSVRLSELRIYDGQKIFADQIRASQGRTSVQVRGWLRPSEGSSLHIEARAVRLQQLAEVAGLKQRLKGIVNVDAKMQGSLEHPTLLLRSELADVKWKDIPSVSGSVSARIDLGRGQLDCKAALADVTGAQTQLDLQGALPRRRTQLNRFREGRYQLSATVRNLSVTPLKPVAPAILQDVEGQLAFELQAQGTLADPHVEAHLSAPIRHHSSTACGQQPTHLDGRAVLGNGRFTVEVDVASRGHVLATAAAAGALGSGPDNLGQVRDAVELDEISLLLSQAQLGELPLLCKRAKGQLSGRLMLSQLRQAPQAIASLQFDAVAVGEVPPLNGKARIRAQNRQIEMKIELSEGRGTLKTDVRLPMNWQTAVAAESGDVREGRHWSYLPSWAGDFSLATDRSLDGSMHVRSWPVAWLVSLFAALGFEPAIDGTPLADLRGALSLSGQLGGTLFDPALKVEAQTKLKETPFGSSSGQLRARFQEGQATARLDLRDAEGKWLQAWATLSMEEPLVSFARQWPKSFDRAAWSVRSQMWPRPLSQLPFSLPSALTDRPMKLAARTQLAHSRETGAHGWLSAALFSNSQGSEGKCGPGPSRLSLRAALRGGQLKAHLQGTSNRKRTMQVAVHSPLALERLWRGTARKGSAFWKADAHFYNVDLSQLPLLCGKIRGELSGKISAQQNRQQRTQLRGRLHVRGLSLGARSGLDATAKLEAASDQLRVEARLRDDGRVSQLFARLPVIWRQGVPELVRDRPLLVRAHLDAMPVAPLVPAEGPVTHASGKMNGRLHLAGTLQAPQWQGAVELDSVDLVITDFAQPLRRIRGRIRFDNRRLHLEKLTAHDRDGIFQVDGDIRLLDDREFKADMHLLADDFPLRKGGQVFAKLDMSADLTAREQSGRGDVELAVRDASVWLRSDPLRRTISLEPHADMVGALEEDGGAGPALATPTLDQRSTSLRLRARHPLWIQRDDFAFQVTTDLEIQIQDDRVRVVGPLGVRRGFLDLLGQTFEIEPGSRLTFVGALDPNPTVDLWARHARSRSSETVRVHVTGRIREPKLTFFVDDRAVPASEAFCAMQGGCISSHQAEQDSQRQMASVLGGVAAGVLAVSARREIGGMLPVLMVETSEDSAVERVRAGVQLDSLVPKWAEGFIQGVYVEGIVGTARTAQASHGSQQNRQSSRGIHGGVLVELDFPLDLVGTGQYGPGKTWSVDLGWEP